MAYTRAQFIEKLAPFAVAAYKEFGVPASLTIAQGCLESGNGNSGLTEQANNLFGVKGSGNNGWILMETTEYDSNGRSYRTPAKFAKYKSWGDSVMARTKLFLNGVSWDRDKYKGVLNVDGITAAKAVAAAGYATDPNYAELLIDIMRKYNLFQYDVLNDIKVVVNEKLVGMGRMLNSSVHIPLTLAGIILGVPSEWSAMKKVAYLDGKPVAYKYVTNVPYISARWVSDQLEGAITWHADQRKVYIYHNKK